MAEQSVVVNDRKARVIRLNPLCSRLFDRAQLSRQNYIDPILFGNCHFKKAKKKKKGQ